MKPWPHQERAIAEIMRIAEQPEGPIALACPTGGGKTWIMGEIIRRAVAANEPAILYTNRKMLLEQIARNLNGWQIPFGVRASEKLARLYLPVQLSSIPTERVRVYGENKRWELHKARWVFVDEAHNNMGDSASQIINDHIAQGSIVIGPTATPVGMGRLYKHLVVAGTNSELRECGAHVTCNTFAPDEPDLRKIKPTATGEYKEGDVHKVMMTPTIFGRVLTWWNKLNPDHKPTLLFAPGVAESIWFAKEFEKIGVRAAHIDGNDIYVDGQTFQSSQKKRDEIMDASRTGEVPVICNRFVLREGIDAPWLSHCIMATVFGSVVSYLQSGGRLIRSHPGLTHVTLQDHGGNWWRHGSLNADRDWKLDCTPQSIAADRAERIHEKKDREPIVCVKCGAVRNSGPICKSCGHQCDHKVRQVVQLDGSLIEVRGDYHKRRKVSTKSEEQKRWDREVARCKRSGRTFKQARGLYFKDYGEWPPQTLNNMPIEAADWDRKVAGVPFEKLRYTKQEQHADG